jgi:hypothetical protein
MILILKFKLRNRKGEKTFLIIKFIHIRIFHDILLQLMIHTYILHKY